MPQTTYLTLYAASYPILAKVQKPGGVTVVTTVGSGDVPNKPTFASGTIQIMEAQQESFRSSGLDYGERFMPEGGEAAGLKETHGAQPQLKSDERFYTPEEEAEADKKAGVKKSK